MERKIRIIYAHIFQIYTLWYNHLQTLIFSPFLCSGNVCNWLAGVRRSWKISAFTWKVLREHPGAVPGISVSHVSSCSHHLFSGCVIATPRRFGVNHQMALELWTFSQAWEDFCKLCCLVTPVSGLFSTLSSCSVQKWFRYLQLRARMYSSCLQSLFLLLLLFRVQKGCLAFSPLLPDDVCELCVRGVNYLGSQMDWLLRKEEVCIIVREKGRCAQNIKSYKLEVVLKASGVKIPLTPGISLVAFIHSDVCVMCYKLCLVNFRRFRL